MDHYETLGVPRNASKDDIKKAYRRRSSKAHPDKGGTEKDQQAVNAAYAILSDDSKRKRYDETGKDQDQSLAAQAQGVLLSLFNELLENDEVIDFLSTARRIVRKRIDAIQSNIDTGKERVRTIERKRGKVRRKDAGPNAVDMLIEQKVSKLNAAISDLAEGLEVYKHALTSLDAYESTEPPPDFAPRHIHRPMFFGADFTSNPWHP